MDVYPEKTVPLLTHFVVVFPASKTHAVYQLHSSVLRS